MSWTDQELALLRQTPGFDEIEFLGKKRPWLLCQYAFEKAEGQGVKSQDITGTSENGKDVDSMMRAMEIAALQVWAGFLTFPENDDLTLDLVKAGMSITETTRIAEIISAPYKDLVAANSEGKAEGR